LFFGIFTSSFGDAKNLLKKRKNKKPMPRPKAGHFLLCHLLPGFCIFKNEIS
jgi:hypothetical protein